MTISPLPRFLLFGLVAFEALISCAGASEVAVPVLFDMGTEDSPQAGAAVRVTEKSGYAPALGYGWASSGLWAFDRAAPLPKLIHGGNPMRADLMYQRHATPMNRDGVSSAEEMRFQIDVAPGTYRVQIWLGDLHHALESMAVSCNGKTIATGISAKHIIGRSKPEATGLPAVVRFDVDAADGRIGLRFYGDSTQYEQDIAKYNELFPDEKDRPESYLRLKWKLNQPLRFDPKTPFQRNSVLAIRVAPQGQRVFAYDETGALHAVGVETARFDSFVRAFNRREFVKAEALLEQRSLSSVERLQGFLALLGHPEVEGQDEARVLAKAQETLETLLQTSDADIVAVEAKESLDVFSKARRRFLEHGYGEEGHFQENRKVVSMMRLIPPDDLLFYKSLVYQGRALQMLDPHRWSYPGGDALRVWKKLFDTFPNNRFARYYLKDEWTPDQLWHPGSYEPPHAGAPEWAVAQREAWYLLLEMCEYWADHKQQADGSIGGGWGDDVELVYLFGMMGFISDGASEKSIRLAERLIDGLWQYGGMDPDAGFYRGVLDAEHSAEWTGDSLPLMLLLKWDHPIWHERAMKTARLMSQLWMDVNDRGDFHFRSNYLGARGIGNEDQANDSYINIRATLPAMAAYNYNRNPRLGALFVKWADAWLNDSLRTDRGKPRGVFPGEVGFPCGTLGGVNSPAWYLAAHPLRTVNYDWDRGQYTFYLVDLMLLAREITGDDKYLEPFHLQKELVDRYLSGEPKEFIPGSEMWAAQILSEGTDRSRIKFEQTWSRIQKAVDASSSDRPPTLTDKEDVLSRMNNVRVQVRRRWPVLTTETSASDRVGFPGLHDPFVVMTGTSTEAINPSATYSGVGRDFAAFVKHADERHLTVVMYNFADEDVEAGITPWLLDVGGSYEMRTGTDTDGDDLADEAISETSLKLQRSGVRVTFPFPARQTTIVELRQTAPGQGTEPLADLAVVPGEVEYSIWTRDLTATVHNIGSRAANKIRVTFYESEPADSDHRDRTVRKIGEAVIPHLPWPADFSAKTQLVAVPYEPKNSPVELTVVVDELGDVAELSETNNRATRLLDLDLEDVRAPRNRVGEIGGDVSGEIKRGLR